MISSRRPKYQYIRLTGEQCLSRICLVYTYVSHLTNHLTRDSTHQPVASDDDEQNDQYKSYPFSHFIIYKRRKPKYWLSLTNFFTLHSSLFTKQVLELEVDELSPFQFTHIKNEYDEKSNTYCLHHPVVRVQQMNVPSFLILQFLQEHDTDGQHRCQCP